MAECFHFDPHLFIDLSGGGGGGGDETSQRMRPVGAGDLRCVLRGLGRSSEVETRDLGTVREMSCYKYSSVYTQSTFANKGRQT